VRVYFKTVSFRNSYSYHGSADQCTGTFLCEPFRQFTCKLQSM